MTTFLATKDSSALNLNIEKPVSGSSDFDTELFINVVIKFTLNGQDHEYRPTGARFTTKLKNQYPKLFKALTTKDNPVSILEQDYKVVKGEEVKKEEYKKVLASLDSNLQSMLTALTPETENDYTSYLKIVGKMYAVSKSGAKTEINVFNPSMDVKVGTEAKELDRQKLLLAAVLSDSEVSIEIESVRVNSESSEQEEEDY